MELLNVLLVHESFRLFKFDSLRKKYEIIFTASVPSNSLIATIDRQAFMVIHLTINSTTRLDNHLDDIKKLMENNSKCIVYVIADAKSQQVVNRLDLIRLQLTLNKRQQQQQPNQMRVFGGRNSSSSVRFHLFDSVHAANVHLVNYLNVDVAAAKKSQHHHQSNHSLNENNLIKAICDNLSNLLMSSDCLNENFFNN